MTYRNGNYTAFYVATPFSELPFGAHATPDFLYYNTLRAWKGQDCSFPFNDSHNKNYNVRDESDWDLTLKPRLHERLRNSKNIILFLSSNTKNSCALHEEIDYGINVLGLPVIVVYPEYKLKSDIVDYQRNMIKPAIQKLWNCLPVFRDSMCDVPTIHLPMRKELIDIALKDKDFMVQTKCEPNIFWYKL